MKKILFISIATLAIIGCKQDFVNPGAISNTTAFSSARNLTGVAVGLQQVYSVGRLSPVYNSVTAAGALTGEFRLMNAGNVDEAALFTGGASVDNLNGILGNLWTWDNKILYDAENVLNGAKALGDKNYASGLIAYATIYKALALGHLCMFWEQVPAAAAVSGSVTFQSRLDGYKRAVTALKDAQAALAANPPSASFFAYIPAGIDINYLNNTINALIARYSLFAADYAGAITAANAVNLSYAAAVLNYEAANTNPIFTVVTATNNVYQIIDSTFGLPAAIAPAVNDGRIGFYTSINPTVAPRYRINGFWNSTMKSIPLYLPGEIRLIRAEALLRQSSPNTAAALTDINAVLTKTVAQDAFGVAANLPAYTGATDAASLLTEVYKQRCVELCMSGMRLEDSRRFNRPVAERKRSFFPYPSRERDNNPNTPADPAF